MDRVLIAGTHSGCGKTTVSCALIAALRQRGLDVGAFKCGPDYIDPMFHRAALGVPSHNLDPYFCDAATLRGLVSAYGRGVNVIEGAMGYYDGIAYTDEASSYAVARATDTPAVLVVDARGAANSLSAVIEGFARHRADSGIRGVIFNGAGAGAYAMLSRVAQEAGVQPLGFLPREEGLAIQSRHLGLVTAAEIDDLQGKLRALGELAQRHIDLDGVLALAAAAPRIAERLPGIEPVGRARIAVARDEACCFLYEENLDVLRALGCEPVFFSPLHDERLPDGIDGLYLCGGYPELHAEALRDNRTMLRGIKAAVDGGLPTIAECGGFMLLCDELDGHPMAGVIHAQAYRTDRLQRFGYAELVAQKDNLLCGAGDRIRAREFHYYDSTANGADFVAHKAGSERTWPCVHAGDALWAGFAHLYFYGNLGVARRFAQRAGERGKR